MINLNRAANIKQIVWEKGYIEDQEYELVTYQTVELECGHKTKIKKDGFYRSVAICPTCKVKND